MSLTAVIYGIQTNFINFTLKHLILFLIIGIGSALLENLTTYIGAKKMGARFSGHPMFYPSFGMCSIPLIWDIKNLSDNLEKRLTEVDLRIN